jgi:hypothetical protein
MTFDPDEAWKQVAFDTCIMCSKPNSAVDDFYVCEECYKGYRWQEKTGRCFRCRKPLDECDCDISPS